MELELGLGQCQQINEKHKQETRAGIGLIKWRFVSLIRIIIAGQTNPETGEKKSAVTWQFAHCIHDGVGVGNDVTNIVLRCDKKHQMGWLGNEIFPQSCAGGVLCSVEIFSKWQVNDVEKYRTTCRAVNQQMKRRLDKSNSTFPALHLFLSHSNLYYRSLSVCHRLGLFWQVIMKMFWVIETKAKPGQVNQTMGQQRRRMTTTTTTTTVGFLSSALWAVLSVGVGVAWAEISTQHVEMLPIEPLEKCQH